MKPAAALVLLLAMAAAAPGAAPQGTSQSLRQQFAGRLERIASDLDGVLGYTVVDLRTGDRFERLANEPFPTASTIKLAILYELFRQADEGRQALDTPRPFDRAQAVGGSGVLFELSNVTMTLRDYATLMIVLSDNSATNLLIDAVGMDRVNARMRELGVPDLRLQRKMMDLQAALEGRENLATPAAVARLLEIIRSGQGLTPKSRDAVLAILQKDKTTPMRRGIPAGVKVANKPGELDAVRVDAGIVEVPERPYIFVAMTSWLGPREDGERAIEEASRASYEYFNRLASSTEFGRTVR